MSETRITDQQVRLYINKRKRHPQELAAATAGISVRIYGDRLDCYLSGVLVHSTARGSRAHDNRHALDYRRFIDALKRKSQAFKGLAFRDALFPR
ncbi:hypothetical protein QFZ98_004839 [Paraburkholderia youngii]